MTNNKEFKRPECSTCHMPSPDLYADGGGDLMCLSCTLTYLHMKMAKNSESHKIAEEAVKDKPHSPFGVGVSTKIMYPPTGLVAVYLRSETVDFVKRMAQQMATQNNRMTATPYFFTIKETAVVTAAAGRGDSFSFLNSDCDESYTVDELRDYINNSELPTDAEVFANADGKHFDGLPSKESLLRMLDDGDAQYVADALDMELVDLQTIRLNTNAFFTEQAAQTYLESRGYQYREDSSVWLERADNNPEMDVVWDLIMQIGGIKGWRK